MQRTFDAVPDTRDQAADQAADVAEAAPDDAQAAGLVQEDQRQMAPDVDQRDHDALASRPVRSEPNTADVKDDGEAADEVDGSAERAGTARQLGQHAVDGAGTKAPVEKTDGEVEQATAGAEADAVEADDADDAAPQRADVGARAGSRVVHEEVFTALPRSSRDAPAAEDGADVVAPEAAAPASDIVDETEDDPGDSNRRDDIPRDEAEPVQVEVEEETADADGPRANAGDQPPSGSDGDGNDHNNRGRGGKGPDDGEGPEDGEPEDDGEAHDDVPAGRRPADGEPEEPEVAADNAEPAGDETTNNSEASERDPVETLRAHRNLVGGIERLLDESIANDDDGATTATALELVTARDEMDQFIAAQIAAGTLTEAQVEAVRSEPLEDVELDRGESAGTAEPAERTTDTTSGDVAGDGANFDPTDHLEHPNELSDHDRVMTELRDRVEHANKMAERLTAARDAELIAGIPVDDWLVDAAADAAREASEYYDRNDAVLDDIELGIYDTTDGNAHFSINPAIPEVGDTTDDGSTDDAPGDTDHPWPYQGWADDQPTDDTPASKYENTHNSPPYWDESIWPEGPDGADPKKGGWDINVHDIDTGSGPSGSEKGQYEEVKELSGSVMEHIWNKLSSLHEKIVTNTENRTVERLRIIGGALNVDLYKVSQIESTPLPSRYYLATGHTGFRNGIFGGFREQKPVALKSVSGSNVHAAKIMARQERRQQQLNNAQGSNGLLALATAVRTAYGAKVDEHRARVIYKHEKSNFEYDHIRQRQHLNTQLQHTRYLHGPQREERRQEIRDELRRLRQEEHRFRQHHKSVKSQNVHRRAARGTLKVSGKAIKGTAKGSAFVAKRGAKGTAKAYRRTAETAANRWAARQAGPGGSNRPPRNPGSKHSGRGPRRTPSSQPSTPNGSGNQPNAEDD